MGWTEGIRARDGTDMSALRDLEESLWQVGWPGTCYKSVTHCQTTN